MKKSFINPEIKISLFNQERVSTVENDAVPASAVVTTNEMQAIQKIQSIAGEKKQETINIIRFN